MITGPLLAAELVLVVVPPKRKKMGMDSGKRIVTFCQTIELRTEWDGDEMSNERDLLSNAWKWHIRWDDSDGGK
jgi:hypothetical protein